MQAPSTHFILRNHTSHSHLLSLPTIETPLRRICLPIADIKTRNDPEHHHHHHLSSLIHSPPILPAEPPSLVIVDPSRLSPSPDFRTHARQHSVYSRFTAVLQLDTKPPSTKLENHRDFHHRTPQIRIREHLRTRYRHVLAVSQRRRARDSHSLKTSAATA